MSRTPSLTVCRPFQLLSIIRYILSFIYFLRFYPYRQNQRFCHFPQGKLLFCTCRESGLPRLFEPRNDNINNASFKFNFVLTFRTGCRGRHPLQCAAVNYSLNCCNAKLANAVRPYGGRCHFFTIHYSLLLQLLPLCYFSNNISPCQGATIKLSANLKRRLPRLFEPRNDNINNASFKFNFVLTFRTGCRGRHPLRYATFTIQLSIIHYSIFNIHLKRGLPRSARNDNTYNFCSNFTFCKQL